MIVLDTNVLSEPVRLSPNEDVVRWLEDMTEDVAVTAVSVGEILTGVRALPAGRRRDSLMTAVEQTLDTYGDQILPYDEPAAHAYAVMRETRRLSGHSLSVEDGMIAAICQTRQLTLATRNTRDFVGLDITLIDPWDMSCQPRVDRAVAPPIPGVS